MSFELWKAPGSSWPNFFLGLAHLFVGKAFASVDKFFFALGSWPPLKPVGMVSRRARLGFEGGSIEVFTRHSSLARRWRLYKAEAVGLGIKAIDALSTRGARSVVSFMEVGAASGIATLMLGSYLETKGIRSRLFAVEPAIDSAAEIIANSNRLRLGVRVIPLAVASFPEVEVQEIDSKGLVGKAVSEAHRESKRYMVPALSGSDLCSIVGDVDVVYVDALQNEYEILRELLPTFAGIEFLIVEMDTSNDLPPLLDFLGGFGFELTERVSFHYMFRRLEAGQESKKAPQS